MKTAKKQTTKATKVATVSTYFTPARIKAARARRERAAARRALSSAQRSQIEKLPSQGVWYIGGAKSGMLCFADTAILFPNKADAQHVLRVKRASLPAGHGVQFVPPAEVDMFLADLVKQKKTVGVCLGVEGNNALIVDCDYI